MSGAEAEGGRPVALSGPGRRRTLTLDHPPGNVLDRATCAALAAALDEAAADADSRLLVLRGAGRHFSFGASVEEHLPGEAPSMLEALGAVIRRLLRFPYPTLAALQGRCLGGAFELALGCDWIFCEEGALLAAPEIRLGVFAPAATALLPGRLPRGRAAELLLTGAELPAEEGERLGLVDRVVAPGGLDAALDELVESRLGPLSAASLRVATRAWRGGTGEALCESLAALERRYLEEVLPLRDATEGLRAFLEKRAPSWENR